MRWEGRKMLVRKVERRALRGGEVVGVKAGRGPAWGGVLEGWGVLCIGKEGGRTVFFS